MIDDEARVERLWRFIFEHCIIMVARQRRVTHHK